MGDSRKLREVAQPLVAVKEASLSMLCSASQHALSEPLRGRPPLRILWALMAAALALHLFVLDSLVAQTQRDRWVRAPALEVRSVLAAAPDSTAATASASATASTSTTQPLSPSAPQPAVNAVATRATTVKPAETPAETPAEESRAPAASVLSPPLNPPPLALEAPQPPALNRASSASIASSTSPADAPSPSPPPDGDVPVYRTQVPPSLGLQYSVRRGARSGTAELVWRVSEAAYNLRLDARLDGVPLLTQISQGRIDDAGLAPLRFTEQRTRGGLRAANFQREKNKITFSGPATEYPLLPGSQDHLSWFLQLAAVITAAPERMASGSSVVFHVVSAGGDASVWVFRFVHFETLVTAEGSVRTAKFSREARHLYDTEVDAWLDPARHHVPVKLRWKRSPDSNALELELQSLQAL